MITESMELQSMLDVRQWAETIVEGYAGDYQQNVNAMTYAIKAVMPEWGCTKSEIDWDAVERIFNELLDTNNRTNN